MKKISIYSVAILFALIFAGIGQAQVTAPTPAPVPTEVPTDKPNPVDSDVTAPKPDPTVKVPMPETVDMDSMDADTDETDYEVVMIGKDDFSEGKANLSAEVENLKAEAFLESGGENSTTVRIAFSDLNKLSKDKIYTVWLASGDGEYTKLGETKFDEKNTNAELKGTVPLDSFGLFITVEDAAADQPAGKTYATFDKSID